MKDSTVRIIALVSSVLIAGCGDISRWTEKPGVSVGQDFAKRSKFFAPAKGNLGYVTDIFIEKGGSKVTAAGSKGAATFDAAGNVTDVVKFDRAYGITKVVPRQNNEINYLCRGTYGAASSLLDAKGNSIWALPKDKRQIDDLTFGDLNGDKNTEFVVGFHETDGIVALDSSGKKLWAQPGSNVWHVSVTEGTSKNKSEVLHITSGKDGGKIIARDGKGKEVAQTPLPTNVSCFSLINWPDSSKDACFIIPSDKQLTILNSSGAVVQKLSAPSSGQWDSELRANWVRLDSSGNNYLAVLTSPPFQVDFAPHPVLYIYDHEGHLVYHEVFGEAGGGLAVLEETSGKPESLLIGGPNAIFKIEKL